MTPASDGRRLESPLSASNGARVNTILHGDALATLHTLPDASIHCIVTSPPYWGLRDYGVAGQLGAEPTPDEYVARMVEVFREARRVLRNDGTLWLNLGDSYANNPSTSAIPRSEQGNGTGAFHIPSEEHVQARRQKANRLTEMKRGGLKHKDLVGIPWRVAFALQADGWWLRSDIIWQKPNCMPESVRDRPTKSHEYVFLLTKSERYYYDADAVREPHAYAVPRTLKRRGLRPDYIKALNAGGTAGSHPAGRNKRDVWSVATAPYKGAHFAVMPPALVEPCVLAGCPAGGVVLDPFMGAGTVGVVAKRHSRHYLGIELNAEYIGLAEARIAHERQPVLWSAGMEVSA